MWQKILKNSDWEHSVRRQDEEENDKEMQEKIRRLEEIYDADGFKSKKPTPEQKTKWGTQASKSLEDLNVLERLIKEHDHVFWPEMGQLTFMNAIKKLRERMDEIIKDVSE